MKRLSGKEGFTIIEIVLVLAIAGLIFLMVFVAFPTFLRNERDTQRRKDSARVVAALEQYRVNHDGDLPKMRVGDSNQNACMSSDYSNSNYRWAEDPWAHSDYSIACYFIADYLNTSGSVVNSFKDPDGLYYGLSFHNYYDGILSQLSQKHRFFVVFKAKCGGDNVIVGTGKANDYAVTYSLENSAVVCLDNQ